MHIIGQSSSALQSNTEDSYLLVRDQNGAEKPILLVTKEPTVRGVVVVCSGAERIQVKQRIIDVVSTSLNIKSNNICVIKKEN